MALEHGIGIGETIFYPNPEYIFPLIETPIPTVTILTYMALEGRFHRWIAEGYPADFCLAILDPTIDPITILQTQVVGFTIRLDGNAILITNIPHPQSE